MLYLLHVIVLEQNAVLKAVLDLGQSFVLCTLADDAGEALEAVSGLGDVYRDVLGESFVEDLADERHLGLGLKTDLIQSVRIDEKNRCGSDCEDVFDGSLGD